MKSTFTDLFSKPVSESGYNKPAEELSKKVTATVSDNAATAQAVEIGHGEVLIAAITSCTNTSNPGVMLAAGLVAKKAVEKGLKPKPSVKTSLGPGSRVVTEYLNKTGLQTYLDQIGFNTVGYGCTTCIGNSGPLDAGIEEAIVENDIVAASVLSGNRNFEARVHQNIKANFLMSPPLVVAFALAGRVDIDLSQRTDWQRQRRRGCLFERHLADLDEVKAVMGAAMDAETYRRLYSDFTSENPLWNEIPSTTGDVYSWDANSTYIQQPPFFENFGMDAGTANKY